MNKGILIRPQAAAGEVKREITDIVSKRGTACYKVADIENEETMLIFYDPQEDYCINVQFSRNLHANEAMRQMKSMILPPEKKN